MIKYSPSVSCDINNVMGINTIVKTCSVKITTIRGICHLSSAVWFRTLFINQLHQFGEGNTFSFKTKLVPSLPSLLVLMPWFFALSWCHHLGYWPIVRGIHWSRWIPLTKASNAQLWCFLSSVRERTFEQTMETLVIGNANVLIMTSP